MAKRKPTPVGSGKKISNPGGRLDIELITDPAEIRLIREIVERDKHLAVPLETVLRENGYELVEVDD